jgi:TonB family protein
MRPLTFGYNSAPMTDRFNILKIVLCLLALGAQLDAVDLSQQLDAQYRGKILLLRGFPSGEKLHYDALDTTTKDSPTGIWTTGGFVLIDEVKVDGQDLTIKGRRMLVASRDNGFQFLFDSPKKRKKAPVVEIEARIGPGAGPPEIDALLAKVFLTERDSLAALVPLYWRTCVLAGIRSVNDPKYSSCHFSQEILAIPGVNGPADARTPAREDQVKSEQAESVRVYHPGKAISPPVPVYKPDPPFVEASQKLGFAGTVTVSLMVDDQGTPRNIEVVRPLGGGLDEETIRTVSTWKFEPAKRDGQPVAVHVEVEVSFHNF